MTPLRYRWQPTTAEVAARFGLDPAEVIRFDQNTSPTPSEWTRALAADAAAGLNEYPDATYRPLRRAAAAVYGVETEQVVAGAGIDELILIAAEAFLQPGDSVTMLDPTYSLYRLASLRRGAETLTVPLAAPEFQPDPEALLDAAGRSALTWLCVPNNPTGTSFDLDLVDRVVAATPGVTVIDAAYAEIAGDSWSEWLDRHPRLVVMHTMSKGFGLAGARVGFGLADPEIIDAFDAHRPPGSIGSVSVAVAIAALEDQLRMETLVTDLRTERSRLAEMLREIGLDPYPSVTNFLLCRIGSDAQAVTDALMAEGLMVRAFGSDSSLADHLRFTVRSPDEDDRLVAALRRHLT